VERLGIKEQQDRVAIPLEESSIVEPVKSPYEHPISSGFQCTVLRDNCYTETNRLFMVRVERHEHDNREKRIRKMARELLRGAIEK